MIAITQEARHRDRFANGADGVGPSVAPLENQPKLTDS